jgi:lysozyme family protein
VKTIDQIIASVIDAEGGYVNSPTDAGGETNFGITARTARAAGYFGLVKDMPRSLAEQIYRRDYVQAPGFDKVLAVDAQIAAELVDTGVNLGPSVPTPWLQRILNALNQRGTMYPDIDVDGRIGPATLGALTLLLQRRGVDGARVVLRLLNSLQGVHYLELAEKRSTDEANIYGWVLNRVEI